MTKEQKNRLSIINGYLSEQSEMFSVEEIKELKRERNELTK